MVHCYFNFVVLLQVGHWRSREFIRFESGPQGAGTTKDYSNSALVTACGIGERSRLFRFV